MARLDLDIPFQSSKLRSLQSILPVGDPEKRPRRRSPLYYTILYYTILYYTILYYTTLYDLPGAAWMGSESA